MIRAADYAILTFLVVGLILLFIKPFLQKEGNNNLSSSYVLAGDE